MAADAEGQTSVQRQTGPIDQFLRPKARFKRQLCVPQTVLRSNLLCQQLLCAQLGWAPSASVQAWWQVQSRQHLVQLQFPLEPHSNHFAAQQRQSVCCLQVQQQQQLGSTGTSTYLAAVGHSNGVVHICQVPQLQNSAEAAVASWQASAALGELSEAATARDDAGRASKVIPPQLLASNAVWTIDTLDRLSHCCWAPAGGGAGAGVGNSCSAAELTTSGPRGVSVRRFVEGRHHHQPLQRPGGGPLVRAGQVAYLPPGAAYQLVAASPGGLVLWDCRAASKAVAEISTATTSSSSNSGRGSSSSTAGNLLMQAMPCGQLLLTAAADGQMALYDVRRLSSTVSSVINFGARQSSQQLVASYNVPARADEAAAAGASLDMLPPSAGAGDTGGGSMQAAATSAGSSDARGVDGRPGVTGANHSSFAVCKSARIYPFFSDLQLNPVDCNLVAFVRPDLQVGVFDLYHNSVVQQLSVTELQQASDQHQGLMEGQRPAAARAVWEPRGRVLYTHGLVCQGQHGAGSGPKLQPTIAAVDLGSGAGWQRRRCSSLSGGWGTSKRVGGEIDVASTDCDSSNDGLDGHAAGGCTGVGSGLPNRSGQVVHLPMVHRLIPTELAVASSNGELLMGTLQGDILWLM